MAKAAKKSTVYWTKDDLKLLRKIYPNTLTSEVCTQLGRSLDSVKCKASSLGLTKSKKYLKSIGRA